MSKTDNAKLVREILPLILAKIPKQRAIRSGGGSTSTVTPSANMPEYNITDLGVTGDGINADDKAFQTALDTVGASGGGWIWAKAPGGHFVLGSRMEVRDNTTLAFLSPVKFKAKGQISFFGEVDAYPELNKPRLRADTLEGGTVLQLGALATDDYHNFTVGGKITIRGMSDGAGQAIDKQTTFVTAIDSVANTITIRDPLEFDAKAIYPPGDYEANFGLQDRTYIQNVTFSKFTRNISNGESVLPVTNASIFAVGDYVELSDDTLIVDLYPVSTYPESRSRNQFRIEMARVKEVDTVANTVTIERNCYHNFVAANGGGITKMVMTKDSRILNCHAEYIEDPPTRNFHSFQLRMCVNCHIEDCSVTGNASFGGRGHGIRFDQALDCSAQRCSIVDPKFFESAEGYGVTLYGATHCKVLDCYMSSCRHSVLFFKGACGNIVRGCISVGCRISDFDFHGGNAKYNTVEGCFAIGGPKGTPDSTNKSALKVGNTTHAVGDHYNTFQDNVIVDYPGSGYIAAGGTGSGIEIVPASTNNVFRRNRFIACYRGVYTKSSTRFWDVVQDGNTIEDNYFEGCSLELMYIGGDSDGYKTINNLVFRGNRVRACSRFFIIDGCNSVKVVDNLLEQPSGLDVSNRYAISVSDSNSVYVAGNCTIGMPRGVKLTNCPSAMVAFNRFIDQTENIVFQDGGGNTSAMLYRNEYVRLASVQYSGAMTGITNADIIWDNNWFKIPTRLQVGLATSTDTWPMAYFNKAGQVAIDLHNTTTGQTPSSGSRWRIFADNAEGSAGGYVFGFYYLNLSLMALGMDANGKVIINQLQVTNPGSPVTPTLLNSWVAFGGALPAPAYYKDLSGIVHLIGGAKNGVVASNSSGNIFVLPAGYRPAGDSHFPVVSGTSPTTVGLLVVRSTGEIQYFSGSNTFVDLSSVHFRAAA